MNELLLRRYEKQVMKSGVPKLMAREIVETAYEASKGKNMETYIDYAMTLVYGLKSNVR